MAPKTKSQTLFPAGEPEYRNARLRCAIACQNYNLQPENASPELRAALWLEIVNANNSGNLTTELSANQSPHRIDLAASAPSLSATDDSAATRSAVSPLLLNFDNVPGRGTLPGAHLHLNPEAISKSHQPASQPVASSKGFPGQGITPYLKPPVYIDYGTRLEIAPSTFINRNCKILDTPVRSVRIGERCLIGPDFHIYAVSHPLDYRERKGPADAPSYALDVTIEDECWIGGGVTILGGVTIGRGCVIGANSLVTRDIPAYHIAYGSPARVIRRITAPAAGEDWSWPAIADSLASLANRPLRVRDFFLVVCGMVGVWSLVGWLMSDRTATS